MADHTHADKRTSFLDKSIRQPDGRLGLWQMPNVPLLTWLVARALCLIIKTGGAHRVLAGIAFGALFTWAWLELFQGVNYFRRVLGIVVLVGLITSFR